MTLLTDILTALPIGIIYNMSVHKLGEILNNDLEYNLKMQKNLLLCFGFAIFGTVIGYYIFGNSKKYRNRAIKFGLYFGALLLLIHSVFYNWGVMENDTKLIIMIVILCGLVLYAYKNYNPDTENSTEIIPESLLEDEEDLDDKYGSYALPATYVSYPSHELFENSRDDEFKVFNY